MLPTCPKSLLLYPLHPLLPCLMLPCLMLHTPRSCPPCLLLQRSHHATAPGASPGSDEDDEVVWRRKHQEALLQARMDECACTHAWNRCVTPIGMTKHACMQTSAMIDGLSFVVQNAVQQVSNPCHAPAQILHSVGMYLKEH